MVHSAFATYCIYEELTMQQYLGMPDEDRLDPSPAAGSHAANYAEALADCVRFSIHESLCDPKLVSVSARNSSTES